MKKIIIPAIILLCLGLIIQAPTTNALTENEENQLKENVAELENLVQKLQEENISTLTQLTSLLKENQKWLNDNLLQVIEDIENIQDTLEQFKTSDDSGGELKAYAVTDSGLKALSMRQRILENQGFSPVTISSSENMLIMWVVDAEHNTTISDGTVKIRMMPSNDMSSYYMMSGGDYGTSYELTFDINRGLAIIPTQTFSGDFIMGSVHAPYYQSEQFFMEITKEQQEEEEDEEITFDFPTTPINIGMNELVEIKKGDQYVSGELKIIDEDSEKSYQTVQTDGKVNFTPYTDKFTLEFYQDGEILKSQGVRTQEWTAGDTEEGGTNLVVVGVLVIILIGALYYFRDELKDALHLSDSGGLQNETTTT